MTTRHKSNRLAKNGSSSNQTVHINVTRDATIVFDNFLDLYRSLYGDMPDRKRRVKNRSRHGRKQTRTQRV